jgi:hypothetical protein
MNQEGEPLMFSERYEVDWARGAVAATAPRVSALVAHQEEDDDMGEGNQGSGSPASPPRTIAWGLQFPTHAVVWFADTASGHGCATFASADRALVRLTTVFNLRLVWANALGGAN